MAHSGHMHIEVFSVPYGLQRRVWNLVLAKLTSGCWFMVLESKKWLIQNCAFFVIQKFQNQVNNASKGSLAALKCVVNFDEGSVLVLLVAGFWLLARQ